MPLAAPEEAEGEEEDDAPPPTLALSRALLRRLPAAPHAAAPPDMSPPEPRAPLLPADAQRARSGAAELAQALHYVAWLPAALRAYA